jgi:hypothetical protein
MLKKTNSNYYVFCFFFRPETFAQSEKKKADKNAITKLIKAVDAKKEPKP